MRQEQSCWLPAQKALLMRKENDGMRISADGNVVMDMDLKQDDIGMFQITPERIREASREQRISSGPGQDERWMPSSDELGNLIEMVEHAVNMGQIIDF